MTAQTIRERREEWDRVERQQRLDALFGALAGRQFGIVMLSPRRAVVVQRNGSETNYAPSPYGYHFENFNVVSKPMPRREAIEFIKKLTWGSG